MTFRGEGRRTQAEEGVEHGGSRARAVEEDAIPGEFDGERGRVRALISSSLDGLVGNEPIVAAAAFVFAAGVAPASDIGFINVRNAHGLAVDRDLAGIGQVEDELVAVVDVAGRIDGLEMALGQGLAVGLEADGFDPVEGILQDELIAGPQDQFVRQVGIRRRAAKIQEERAIGLEDAADFVDPLVAPRQILGARLIVGVLGILDVEVVGRGGDNEVDAGVFDMVAKPRDAVLMVEIEKGRGSRSHRRNLKAGVIVANLDRSGLRRISDGRF